MGTIGRQSGQIRLHVLSRTTKAEVQMQLVQQRSMTILGGSCYTDEHLAYWNLSHLGPHHAIVRHGQYEWARDDDGDGINEVHTNTMEGFWTGLRNYLRIFRGVSKHHLYHYVAMYAWIHNVKIMTVEVAHAMAFT